MSEKNEVNMKIEVLNVTDIQANDWNPNEMEKEIFNSLVNTIQDRGFKQPILVRPVEGQDKKYEIVDGEHRFKAMQVAGQKKIPCVVVDISETEAKLDTIAMNRLKGEHIPFQVAQLIVDLKSEMGEEWIKKYAAFNEDEIKEYESMLIPPDLDNDVTIGNDPDLNTPVPIEISIMLMETKKKRFDKAMEQAINLMPKKDTIVQVDCDDKKQVAKYDKSFTSAMELLNTKRRSEALELITDVFIETMRTNKEVVILLSEKMRESAEE